MADEYTGTNNFGGANDDVEPDTDLPQADERDLTEDPLTDDEQGNADINKPTENPDVPNQHVEEGPGGIDNPQE